MAAKSNETTLLKGKKVRGDFTGNNINNVAGDVNNEAPFRIPEIFGVERRRNLETFEERIRSISWRDSELDVDYYKEQNIPDPGFKVYPVMKEAPRFFQGELAPKQESTNSFPVSEGKVVTLDELVNVIKQRPPKHKTIGIIGQMGSGKTAIMKRLTRKLMNEYKLTPYNKRVAKWFLTLFRSDFTMVYLLQAKHIPNIETTHPQQIIFPERITRLTAKEAYVGYRALVNGDLSMILIVDGLDQANWELTSGEDSEVVGCNSTKSIMGDLLSGRLFSKSLVVFSGREHAVAVLPNCMRPDYCVRVTGFTMEDARRLFIALMKEHGKAEQDKGEKKWEKEWEKMRSTSTEMISLSLTPLYLLLNVTVRRSDPSDYMTGVIIKIMNILEKTDHLREDSSKLFKSLKKIAFRLTDDNRVVLAAQDLEDDLKYEEISDIIAKVPGRNDLCTKLREEDYDLFFSQKMFQEVFSALYTAEMKYEEFKKHINKIIRNRHWSVVRWFLCGILGHEKIQKSINPNYFKMEDMQKKYDCLIRSIGTVLRSHEESKPKPTEVLDMFRALKETKDSQIFEEFFSDVGVDGSPLSEDMVCCLSSIIQHFGCRGIRSLEMKSCGLNCQLLQVFVSRTKFFEPKIENFDIRENRSNLLDVTRETWEELFQNLKLKQFRCSIFGDPMDQVNVDKFIDMAELTKGKEIEFFIDEEKLRLTKTQVKRLNNIAAKGKAMSVFLNIEKKWSLSGWKAMGQLFRRCATNAIYSQNGFEEDGIQHIAAFAIGHRDAKFGEVKFDDDVDDDDDEDDDDRDDHDDEGNDADDGYFDTPDSNNTCEEKLTLKVEEASQESTVERYVINIKVSTGRKCDWNAIGRIIGSCNF